MGNPILPPLAGMPADLPPREVNTLPMIAQPTRRAGRWSGLVVEVVVPDVDRLRCRGYVCAAQEPVAQPVEQLTFNQ
jgi:hypothetical protein